MFSKKALSIILLSCCLFKSLSCLEILIENGHDRKIEQDLGKRIFSFMHLGGGTEWYYTTELSRVLLVGEPRVFHAIRYFPVIGFMGGVGPLFDNRFEDFIKKIEQSSEKKLQEAIKDAILLSPYSTKAYSANRLLDYLAEALQNKIVHVKNQIDSDYTWDQESLSYMKKSVLLALGLTACIAITNQYIDNNNGENSVSYYSKSLNDMAILGLFPASYKVLKGCYKVLTTDPNACNQHLEKYEKLLAFVQKLKAQLEENGSITFTLANGRRATLKNNKLIFDE